LEITIGTGKAMMRAAYGRKEPETMSQDLYDTVVIGGGPAGTAAGVYAARKKIKTVLITEEFGGQSTVSGGIENWLGEKRISGMDLAGKLEEHVRTQPSLKIVSPAMVRSVEQISECLFDVTTDKEGTYRTKTLIVASGSRRKYLHVPGEKRLDGKGVAFCATCDAPLYQDRDVAVVGSGNTAMETVVDLLSYANHIYLLCRDPIEADAVSREKVEASDKVTIFHRVEVQEIVGEETVMGVRFKQMENGQILDYDVSGVFIAIGTVPNSEFVSSLVETNEDGEIITDCRDAATSKQGVFAAGDVTTDPFKQNNIAAGDGVRAALSAYYYLMDIEKHSPCAEKWKT